MTASMTPTELAAFDQAWQTVERTLDALLGVYGNLVQDGEATREVDLICFMSALGDLLQGHDVAALLACAVARLADRSTAA